MNKLDIVTVCYDFVRSPTGRRVAEQLARHVANPENRRRLTDEVKRWRSRRQRPVVVDADPPEMPGPRRRPGNEND